MLKVSDIAVFLVSNYEGGSYYYTINHSTLVAFTVGSKYKAGNGFKIIGGHTGEPTMQKTHCFQFL